MKNRKGFTLIELLAVVVVIGILLLIAVPSVSKYLNKGTTKFYNSLEKSMVVSGREYLNDYQALLPKVIGNVTVIELNELTNNNYMDEVKDSNGNVCEGKITVKKIDKNQYDYYSCLICEDYQTEKENCEYSEDNNINNDTKNYTIEVEKDKYIVKQGEIFELPYAKAYYLGQLVSSTVSASPRIIDTNKLGTITVTYAYEGVKKRITVEVIDASGPSIPQIVLKEDNENGKVYNGNWYKGNIYAEYKSTDYTKPGLNGSGIKEYQISQDGINYSSINSNNYTSSSNGEHSYYVRSVDNNGNISESNIYSLKIDKEIPKCELQSSGTQGSNGWYTSDAKLSFKSITEKVSSIKSQSIDNPTVTSDVKDKKVIGTVIDQAGNPGECQTTVSVDKTNPTVSYNVSGGNYSSNKTVTVTASDTYYSHMQIHVYKNGSIVNGDNNITSTTKSYNLTNGTWTIYTKAYDQSGRKQSKSPENSDGWYYQSYLIDTVAPTCSIKVTSGTQGSNGWYTSNVTVGFDTTDGTGSNIVASSISQTTITENGVTTVTATVTDEAGNIGACEPITIKKDDITPGVPTITASDNKASNTWHTSDFTLSYSGASNISGNTYYYGTNTNPTTSGTSTPINTNTTGTTYYVKVCSGAGLCSTNNSYVVKLDKTTPGIPTIAASDNKASNTWHNSDFTLSYSGANNISGNTYYYGTNTSPSTAGSSTPINTNTTGTTYYVKVCSGAGLCSTNNNYVVKLDKTTPSVPTIAASDNKGTNTWHNSDFTLSYSGASNISGNTYYYGTNTSPSTAGSSTPINTNTSGTTYYVKVCSGAGLCSTNNSYEVKLDKTTPGVPTITASDNKASNTWHTSDFTLSYSGASNISGNTYYYGVNTNPTTVGTSTPINTNTTGTTYYVKVCSGAGLCSTNNNYVAKLDKINPTVSYNVVAGTYNSNKTLTVTGSDTNFSYMNVHVYKNGSIVNGDNSITSTTKSYTLTHGTWTVYTQVYDQAGRKQSQSPENSDGWYYQSYLIDTVAPTCSLKVTSGTAGSNGWYTSNVTVGFNTTDGTGSNIASSSISQTTITAEGTTTVTGTVTDQAGHVGTCSKSISIEKTVSIPTITYNGGANSCSWKNNYNLTLSSSAKSGIAHYEIDWDNNGTVDTTTGNNFIPSNGYSSCSNRFRAVSNAGNRSNWTAAQHIHMDTEKPKHTNWWWGTVTKDKAPLYIQVSDNVGISKVQCPTSTATGGYTNWHWFGAVWDASANAYRCDITPATFGHYGQSYKTHLYIYDHAGNGGYYNQTSVTIPASCSLTAGQTWEFSYTGGEQPFTVPCSGTYKLEVYGAQGGSTPNLKYSWMGDVQGGKGGYATGNTKLTAGVLLNVVVGGQGSKAPELDKSSSGGYNGGGLGVSHYSTNASYYGSAGGGATHIATSKGLLSSLENNKESVLIVAGGGGGSVSHTDGTRPDGSKFDGGWHEGYGGGGLIGSQIDDNEYNTDSGKYAGKGGTQTAGGLDSIYIVDRNGLYASRFGQGGYLLKKYYEFEAYQGGSGGGGGGWYGGGACLDYNGAGGGSGHLHSSLTSGSMQNDVREGNGYAKITLVSID